MVRTATLALSGAALVATASSFITTSRPLGAFSAPTTAKLSSEVVSSRRSYGESVPRSMRRGRWAMSSVAGDAHGEVGGERYYGPTSKPLLDSVQSPADMKRFSVSELKQLAYELRWETLEVREQRSSMCSKQQALRTLMLLFLGTVRCMCVTPRNSPRSCARKGSLALCEDESDCAVAGELPLPGKNMLIIVHIHII